jgi:transposase
MSQNEDDNFHSTSSRRVHMADCRFVSVDLAKASFQIHQATARGRVLRRMRKSRDKFKEFLATTPKATIYMEACGGSNYWARRATSYGHTVKLIAPQYVKPFVKRQKNDAADAEAILEAGMRQNMHFVPIKSIAQQDLQTLLRIRDLRVGTRTAYFNQVRGILMEYGIVVRTGMSAVREKLVEILTASQDVGFGDMSPAMKQELKVLWEDLKQIDQQVNEYDRKISAYTEADDRCVRLMKIPGVGPVTAAAIVSAAGNCVDFRNSRQFSAWLGLVPRQHSTGGRTRLMGLSKQGNRHLRTLLIHGGRAVLMNTGNKKDPRSLWAESLKKKVGMNKAAVAMANKNARTVWALLHRGTEYQQNYISSPRPAS